MSQTHGMRPLKARYAAVLVYLLASFALIQIFAFLTLRIFPAEETTPTFRFLLVSVVVQMAGALLPAPFLMRFTGVEIFRFQRVPLKEIFLACGLIFLSLIFFSVLYSILQITPKQLGFLDTKEIYNNRYAFLVATVVVVPGYEEWIFRGLLFGTLTTGVTQKKYLLAAALFCAILFTLSHIEGAYSFTALPPILAMALIFQYVTWRSQSLWPAVCGHALQNLLAASAMVVKAGN